MNINRKNIFITVTLVILFNTVNSQNDNINDKTGANSVKHLSGIEIEPFGIGYFYAHKISKNGFLGISINTGLGVHFFINTPQYIKYKSGVCDSTGCYFKARKNFLSPTIEFLKFKVFYKVLFENNINVELGAYMSLGDLPVSDEKSSIEWSKYNIGGSLSIFYGCKKMKFGQRLQFGNYHIKYNNGNIDNVVSVILTPIIVRFSW